VTAQTTIEALLHELRNGLGALAEPGTRGRLARCDSEAIREVASRLRQGHGGRYDPNWSDAEIQSLLIEWNRMHGGR
jgi:hypothetical protein